jgi:p-hydroxybenzoate 3-monooxygenase
VNLAAADVKALAAALVAWFRSGDDAPLQAYSETCLERVWRTEQNATWLTRLLHRHPDGTPMDARLGSERARLGPVARRGGPM